MQMTEQKEPSKILKNKRELKGKENRESKGEKERDSMLKLIIMYYTL